MSDKSATEALHRLGAPIPFSHPIHPPMRESGGADDCPVCGTSIEPMRCCQECSQVFGWGWVEAWISAWMDDEYCWPPLPQTDIDSMQNEAAMATSEHLVQYSNYWKDSFAFTCLMRSTWTVEEQKQQRHVCTWKRIMEAELDRRAARGIEDE